MNSLSWKRTVAALALAAALGGGAISVAQTGRGTEARPRVPQRRLQAQPDDGNRTAESRAVRALIEELESSTPEEVRSGSISRYFADPAVIITDGRMHRVDWARLRNDRLDERNREERDRPDEDARANNPDPADERLDREPVTVRLEGFQLRRIDPRTVVALYTAVLPDRDGVFRQPVVATLIREGSRSWRVASYTAENAPVPGAPAPDEVD